MNNLLTAAFRRMKNDKVFSLCLTAIVIICAWQTYDVSRAIDFYRADGITVYAEANLFDLLPTLPFFSAVFTSLFIGTEYSDGAMRNKITVGRRRSQIYMSNFTVSFTASMCFWLVSIGVGLFILYKMPFSISAGKLAELLAVQILILAAITAILNILCMNTSSRAISAVAAIILIFVLTVVGSYLYNSLQEPPCTSGVVIHSDGGMEMAEPTVNPHYVSGVKRHVYQFLVDFLPTGQAISLSNMDMTRPLLSMASSTFITVLATFAGIYLFERKDLK